uniref:Homeobox domain-containing protein n=1 Tax=Macrostomum lignano TaxID=282301 RepID=A0A1I8FBV3_9PLAT
SGALGGHDLDVRSVWSMGYSGKGLVVSILDDGIEHWHSDLKDNYDPDASYDINGHDADPAPRDTPTNVNRSAPSLTACQLSCRPVDFGGPAPTAQESGKVTCRSESGHQPLLPARKFSKLLDSSAAKPAPGPASRQPSRLPQPRHSGSRLKPPADAADAEDALLSQPQQLYPQSSADCSIPPASSSTNSPSSASSKSACGILDLSLKRLADAGVADVQKPQQQQQQASTQSSSSRRTIAKPQRQEFHRRAEQPAAGLKPYPSTADTHRLAELTGLSYPQVKKWFANRRMRDKNSLRAAARRCASGRPHPQHEDDALRIQDVAHGTAHSGRLSAHRREARPECLLNSTRKRRVSHVSPGWWQRPSCDWSGRCPTSSPSAPTCRAPTLLSPVSPADLKSVRLVGLRQQGEVEVPDELPGQHFVAAGSACRPLRGA